jgi:hypothetical protein
VAVLLEKLEEAAPDVVGRGHREADVNAVLRCGKARTLRWR